MSGCWERFGAIARNVGYINPQMVVQLGSSFCMLTQKQVVPIWPWTPPTPMFCTLQCGNFEERAGHLSPVATKVRCTSPQMGEKLGTKYTMASLRENWGDWPLQWHPQIPMSSTPLSKRKRTSVKACTVVTMPVRLGSN